MRHLDKERIAPDILDCIANLSSDEVFTPPRLANQMLNLLPKEVWTNPDLKWLDPGTKTGVFLREIARRLMDGLSEAIPGEDARREHIYKNMLFGLPITELTSMLARRSVYYSKNADHEHYAVVRMGSPEGNIPLVEAKHTFKSGSCTLCGAPESLERGESRENYAYPFIHPDQLPKGFKDMKFDVIVGNPPYQISDGGNGASATPIYQRFVETGIDMDPRYVLMIVPSRWFAGGKGLDGFRERMISDRRISHIVDYLDAAECFPGIEIKGGVNYFLWDRTHDGPCAVSSAVKGRVDPPAYRTLDDYDIFVRSNQAISILSKVKAVGETTLDTVVSARKPFGLPTNFTDFSTTPISDGLCIYARGTSGWVSTEKVSTNLDMAGLFKVLISKAYGGSNRESVDVAQQVIGEPILAPRSSVCTETYLVAGSFETELESSNYADYLKSRFVRFLISLRKNTQDVTRERFAFVPALDMNITWTDEMLFARYNLAEDEILFIKSQIKEMP